jgi:hypothetical protein
MEVEITGRCGRDAAVDGLDFASKQLRVEIDGAGHSPDVDLYSMVSIGPISFKNPARHPVTF